MGSVGLNSPRLGAFQNAVFPRGLDLGRCVILQDIGVFRADPASYFEAGSLVAQDASGNIVPCAGKSVFGVAKWNKALTYTGAQIDEPISFALATSTVLLKHSNVTQFQLRSAVGLGGVQYVSTTDYTLTGTNGAIQRINPGATPIPLATTVYATYTYQLSSADLDFQGRNFWNFTDDVTIQDGKITVITDASVLFTSMYDTIRQDYALTGAGKNLYCGGGVTAALKGLFTTDSAEGEFVGHVIQVPTADDPFLGVRLGGDPVKYA